MTVTLNLPKIVIACLVVIALVAAGIGIVWLKGALEGVQTYTIHGTITAPKCAGGFNIENAAVEVRDQDNKLIGASQTGINENLPGRKCKTAFQVDVKKADFYQVNIGSHSGPSYPFAEMDAINWKLTLSLGG